MYNMRAVVILSAILSVVAAYTDLDDNFDYVGLVNSHEKSKVFLDCFFDRGPCTDVMAHYKSHALEAVTDACNECNEVEKHLMKVFLDGMRAHEPAGYEEFRKRFDPTGTHFKTLVERVKNY